MSHASSHSASHASRQTQFLDVVSREEAERRFRSHLKLHPLGEETIPLALARERVLAKDVRSTVDVPGFDRSNVDGFAVQAADTYGATEEEPVTLKLNAEILSPGVRPLTSVQPGTATTIATGGMFPRGADAVVMVEQSEVIERDDGPWVHVRRSVAPGESVTFAGTDIASGETTLWAGQLLTAREIGILAAIGCDQVEVYRRPRVAIISTGDEIIPPGQPLPVGAVYDSNSAIVAATVEELGGEPILMGSVPDDEDRLRQIFLEALKHDIVIMSGGTSKGAGDLSYRVVHERNDPGIVAHGVALKPGKPICLAVTQEKPVVILPGFPTSAIFTFREFVAPVIRAMAGLPLQNRGTVRARLPIQIHSARGRTEYNLVGLVESKQGLVAYPIGKGSGSVSTFSHADGFFTIPQLTEIVPAESEVEVTLIDEALQPADLVVIGSHCLGLDALLSRIRQSGFRVKSLAVGSTAGLNAVKRNECDIAGIHLLDPESGIYNHPFLDDSLTLLPGYRRMQGIVYREGDTRFERAELDELIKALAEDPECMMVNRNPGSGTRILLDQLLKQTCPDESRRPAGYGVQAKSHNAVAAAVSQERADWGLAIETAARAYGLKFRPIQEEHYDFAVPTDRLQRPAVQAFQELLNSEETRAVLSGMGFRFPKSREPADRLP